MNYDKTNIALKYDTARQLPAATLQLWLDTIEQYIKPSSVHSVVDVGCGTGRFSSALADKFNAEVIGIDPSKTMLAKAIRNTMHPNVKYCEGNASYLPIKDKWASFLFLSMVYHHIDDKHKACQEFNRVLQSNGFLCVRNFVLDRLDQVIYLKYFPSAKKFNIKRLPTQYEIINTMEENGFSLIRHEIIMQEFAPSMHEYCEKIGQRALSDLVAISDEEFSSGMKEMNESISGKEMDKPTPEPIDLFIFSKSEEACT